MLWNVCNVSNIHLQFCSMQGAPYVMEVMDGSMRGVAIEQRRFEGYCIDLIEQISKELGFKYTFELVPDNKYGNYDEKIKSWNGLIKRLLDRVCMRFPACMLHFMKSSSVSIFVAYIIIQWLQKPLRLYRFISCSEFQIVFRAMKQ